MSDPIAFSFSRLNQYEECPKKFHAVGIAKSVREVETQPMKDGKAAHKALELRVRDGKVLPPNLVHLESMAKVIVAAPGDKRTEQQLAINANYEPTGWFDKDVYCRAIVDLSVNNGPRAVLFDYKTGKMSPDFTQMRLTGAVYFEHQPAVELLDLAYVWLKSKKITKETMRRDEIPDVWNGLLPRIQRYQDAFGAQDFPARPGRQCKWCPVKSCPYNENPK